MRLNADPVLPSGEATRRNLLRCFRGLDHLTTKQPIHVVGDSPREACFHRSNRDSEREAVKSFIIKTELGGTGRDGRINGGGDCAGTNSEIQG